MKVTSSAPLLQLLFMIWHIARCSGQPMTSSVDLDRVIDDANMIIVESGSTVLLINGVFVDVLCTYTRSNVVFVILVRTV